MKSLVLTALLLSSAANAGSISVQVVEGGQPTQTKTYTVADADIDRIVAAFQSGANVQVNGTATRTQVLFYWFMIIFVDLVGVVV